MSAGRLQTLRDTLHALAASNAEAPENAPQQDSRPQTPYDETLQENIYLGSAGDASQEGKRPDLAAMMQQAVEPLMQQLQDNRREVQSLVLQVLGDLTGRIEHRLAEERAHADRRLQRHEELLRSAELWLRQSSQQQHLQRQEAQAQQPQQQQQQQPPFGTASSMQHGSREVGHSMPANADFPTIASALAPVEAALARIEATLTPARAMTPQEDVRYARPLPSHQWAPSAHEMLAAAGWSAHAPEAQQQPERTRASPASDRQTAGSSADEDEVQKRTTRADEVQKRTTSASQKSFDKFFQNSATRQHLEDDSPTLFGLTYEELQRYKDSSSAPAFLKDLIGLGLRWLDWSQAIAEPERKGCLAKFIESKWFETYCACVIMANATFMIYTVNIDMMQAMGGSHQEFSSEGILIAELTFLGLYTAEILLKMMVHRLYFFVGPDLKWNIFDLTIILLALADQVISIIANTSENLVNGSMLRCLRILKLAKILRMERIMRVFRDLRLLLSSVMGSCVSLFWSFVMLTFVYYIFALFLIQNLTLFLLEADASGNGLDPRLKQDIQDNFGTVLQAMLSLCKATTGGNDWDAYFSILWQTDITQWAPFLFLVGFVQISLMNILTAVFVEKALRLAEPETREQAKEERRKELSDTDELREMCQKMDVNKSGSVSAEEFRSYLESFDMRCCLKVLGLDIQNAQEFFELLAHTSEDQDVDIEAFVQGCMQMRGNAKGIAVHKVIVEANLLRMGQKELACQVKTKLDTISKQLKELTTTAAPTSLSSSLA